MKIYDENGNEVSNPDMENGYTFNRVCIKDGAIPPDGVDKIAYYDDDYETRCIYREYCESELRLIRKMKADSQMRLALTMFVRTSNLTDEQALDVSELYEEWSATGHYNKGEIRRYKGLIYRCRQEHDAQEAWNPEHAHSLWGRIVPNGDIPEWKRPQPGIFDGYTVGQRVTRNGKTWESVYDGLNVWEPGAVGTEALWKEVC